MNVLSVLCILNSVEQSIYRQISLINSVNDCRFSNSNGQYKYHRPHWHRHSVGAHVNMMPASLAIYVFARLCLCVFAFSWTKFERLAHQEHSEKSQNESSA